MNRLMSRYLTYFVRYLNAKILNGPWFDTAAADVDAAVPLVESMFSDGGAGLIVGCRRRGRSGHDHRQFPRFSARPLLTTIVDLFIGLAAVYDRRRCEISRSSAVID